MIRALAAVAALAWAAAAGAHAELVASTPSDGAVLPVSPPVVELRFNEPVSPLAARLLDGTGAVLPLGALEALGDTIRIPIRGELARGQYTLSFRIASLDSHPVGGTIVFGVGVVPAERARPESESMVARVLLRGFRDLALLIAAGGGLFILLVARFAHERRILVASALAAALASLVAIGVQGVGLRSSFGLAALVASGGALVLAAGVLARAAALLALGAAAMVGSLALTGHAATAGALGRGLIAAHAAAAAFWAGSLVALLVIVRRDGAAESLQRFSRLGVVAVVVLFACGAAFLALQLPDVAALWRSRYGILALSKLLLLVALLVLACLNRYRYLPSLARSHPQASTWLRRSILGELMLMTAVVALTAVLAQTPPPRQAAGFQATLRDGGRAAELRVSPARAGTNTVRVRFPGLLIEEATLSVANAAAGVEPAARPMRRVSASEFERTGPELAFSGVWSIEVQARVGDFDLLHFHADVPVAAP